MKDYPLLQLIVVIFVTPCVFGLPTEEATIKTNRNSSPVMQTLLADITRELISRSTSNTQILTLNVTNLLVLLILKGLLWGASYAATAPNSKARSEEGIDEEPYITETEILLLLSYLMGNEDKNFQCLHRVACEDPRKATEYLNAGRIITNAAEFFGINDLNANKYQTMLDELKEAIQFKENGGNCDVKYSCHHNSENNI